MDQASTKKMTPGDDMHLTLLMAPHNLNLVTVATMNQEKP